MPNHSRSSAPRAVAFLVAALALLPSPPGSLAQTNHLPTLTTVAAVHSLSRADAARAYPVELDAVVAYFDPYIDLNRPVIMVTDSTASIYVGIVGQTAALKPGTLIHVTGVSNPGDFGPSILQAHVRAIRPSALPSHAPRESLTHLLTGSEDAQWIELEGIVKSFEVAGMNVTLKLALADGEMTASTVKDPAADYTTLVDSKVLIRGIAATLFNRQSQLFGVRLFFPGMEAIHIEEPGPAQPFLLPVSPIRSLMQYHPRAFTRRVHVQGTVTLFWPGRMVCVQDGGNPYPNTVAAVGANMADDSDSLCAETLQTSALAPGDLVDLIGFPQIGTVRPTLSDAVFQALPRTQPPTVEHIDAKQAFSAIHDSQLVQMEGTIIAHDRASSDPTIVVTSGNFTFPVILPKSADARGLLALQDGSRLKLTGICSIQADTRVLTRHDGYPVARFFQILLRSSSDAVVLQKPSWWTAEHTLRVLAIALVVTMLVLIWSGFLRVRLKQQTELLRYQATHDSLTGIWNRKAVLDLLRREFEQAVRVHQCIGVMMLDADHFKQVNDTYGHLAGDAVLKEVARRIQESLRSYDLTGRYGGEEFLIVLPGCRGEELFLCAERVRAAVASSPITAEGTPLAVTISVGIAVLDPLRNSEKDALAAADSALYEAKHTGRNRVVSGDLQPRPTLTHAV